MGLGAGSWASGGWACTRHARCHPVRAGWKDFEEPLSPRGRSLTREPSIKQG